MLSYSLPSVTNAAYAALVAVAVAVVGALLYPLVVYLRDENGLRKYPAPSVAAFTPLWQMYHNYHGRKYLAIDAAHRRLGPVVRVAPNHLSFSSPNAYRAIYGHGVSIMKDVFYDNQAGGNPHMADATDKTLHRNKRKNLSHVFSPAQITAMEPRVARTVRNLVAALNTKAQGGRVSPRDRFPVTADGVFDARPWFNMFSFDAISTIFWSQPYGFLARGDDDCFALRPDGQVEPVHAMETFQKGAAFSVFFGHLTPFWYDLLRNKLLGWTFGGRCGDNFTSMARYLATQRLRYPPGSAKPSTSGGSETSAVSINNTFEDGLADLFSYIPTEPTPKRPVPMQLNEIVAESSVMLNAGNDTTQTALTNTVFLLARHPDKQAALRSALRAALSPEDIPVAPYATLQHVPYLRAVIDEAFRLRPPLAGGPPRRTTAPTVIDGEMLPAGVSVSGQALSLHHNPDLFRDADAFVPERWLADNPDFTETERQNLRDYVIPFSMGPRACIGRNLAYMELSVCLAAVVLAFEWELGRPGFELKYHEKFNCNPVELLVRAKPLLKTEEKKRRNGHHPKKTRTFGQPSPGHTGRMLTAAPASPPRYRGGCRCGGIRYTLTTRPRRVIQCYCTDCQRDAGSEYQIMAEYKSDDVVVEDPLSYWKIYTIRTGTRSGQPKERHFCGNCGCLLWTVAMKDHGELRMVRTSEIENGFKLFPPTEIMFKKIG
ncbi:Cytochrome P450 [Niveomyces insectorum RCEF 264]|uniref:Cytochrome P450 n=1 Tax=Niveomyces insectorum RCEF 264 TaxID=1081102 RepID=A0A167P5F6_9HYPO|nr:Cytochrome P450 [Niveomyces insectorum RCEF 264]